MEIKICVMLILETMLIILIKYMSVALFVAFSNYIKGDVQNNIYHHFK